MAVNIKLPESEVQTMKRYVRVFALIAALALMFCACGGSKQSGSSETRQSDVMPSANTAMDNGFSGRQDLILEEQKSGKSATQTDVSTSAGTTLPSIRDNTKVIYTAGFRLQTTEFEKTQTLIQNMVADCGGYIESANVYNDSIYKSSAYKTAEYTVRVPAEKYDSFISGVSENCHVISLSQNAQDVGEQYFNTEQRLQTLNNKHERLEALLKEASTMNDIIQLENALSDCEYEINRLQTTLNRYDSLIGFSTVTISLQEVARPDNGIDEQPGFFARLGRSFSEGFERFTEGAEDLAIWLSGHILTLVVIIAIIIALIKIKPAAKIRKRAAAKRAAANTPLPPGEK